MKVRVHGGVTYYCGEIELNLSSDYNGSIEIISDDITPLERSSSQRRPRWRTRTSAT